MKLNKYKSLFLVVLVISMLISNVVVAVEAEEVMEIELEGEVLGVEDEKTEKVEKIVEEKEGTLRYTEKEYTQLLLKISELEAEKENLEKENKQLKRKISFFPGDVKALEADKIPVLLYHHLLPQADIVKYGWKNNSSTISVEAFRQQMKYLKDNGYYTATIEELEQFARGELSLPKKTVVISFDDGYISNIKHAYPIMKEYGQKGTIFIIGNSNDREKEEYNPASTQRIYVPEAEKHTDVFKFECHTYDMHDMVNGKTKLETATKEAMVEDLKKSQSLFNATSMAYPSGRTNDKVIGVMKELGYSSGFTIKEGYVKPGMDMYRLPRFVIAPYTSMERFKTILK